MSSPAYRLRRPAFKRKRLLAGDLLADGRAHPHIATHREPRHATAEVTFANQAAV
ncbi:hypothetical protein OHT57_42500 [Streptomyces sp. NBC_00285]|uniref:hypothetical protein n=1 Tax=Streptomyces sp. NBC_00285 TaxID=2975700 RepID=UPI002E2E4A47|nr:hypothetical protein [Streptomyces sp. NBC_00285]